MRHIFKFLFLIYTINFVTLYGAAAAPAPTPEPEMAIEAHALAAHADGARAALDRTGIVPALYPIIFGYLASKEHKARIIFPGIRQKYATSSDGKGFYATNSAGTLSHHSCQNGATTPLKENFKPDGYEHTAEQRPRKSWIINNHLMAIALYTSLDRKDDHWFLSSTNLIHPHTTNFLELTPTITLSATKATPAVQLTSGLVIDYRVKFALHSPSDLKVIQEFTRPTNMMMLMTLRQISNTQFMGHFMDHIGIGNRLLNHTGNHFYYYDANQSAPLHIFSIGLSLPRIFPCLNQRNVLISDRDGSLRYCDHPGRLYRDYTPAWARRNKQADIHRLPDGSGFLAYDTDKIMRIDFATPDKSTSIDSIKVPQLHKLKHLAPGQLLAIHLDRIAIMDINTQEVTGVFPHALPSANVRIMHEGFLTISKQIEFHSKKSLLELACQAPHTSAPKKPASSPAAALATASSTLPSLKRSLASPATPSKRIAAAARGHAPASRWCSSCL